MADPSAALSAVQTGLEELTDRIVGLAGDVGREEIAHDLYEVERSLRTALRRLESLRRSL